LGEYPDRGQNHGEVEIPVPDLGTEAGQAEMDPAIADAELLDNTRSSDAGEAPQGHDHLLPKAENWLLSVPQRTLARCGANRPSTL
jgi:hypothetical protein